MEEEKVKRDPEGAIPWQHQLSRPTSHPSYRRCLRYPLLGHTTLACAHKLMSTHARTCRMASMRRSRSARSIRSCSLEDAELQCKGYVCQHTQPSHPSNEILASLFTLPLHAPRKCKGCLISTTALHNPPLQLSQFPLRLLVGIGL